jgi:spermidine synthase
MIPWEFLDSTKVPGSGAELSLHRHGRDFSIRVDNHELMNSRVHGSEEALAKLACERVDGRKQPCILIGGLGMGFTLAAALQQLGTKASIELAELVPALIEWNRGPLGELTGHPVLDSRVTIHEADVARILKTKRRAYDAVLLDVDNGPEGLTRQGNDWLYSHNGLNAAFKALRPEGVLAVWSAGPDRTFTKRLRQAGFEVDEVRIRARGPRGGARHTIWIAERSSID